MKLLAVSAAAVLLLGTLAVGAGAQIPAPPVDPGQGSLHEPSSPTDSQANRGGAQRENHSEASNNDGPNNDGTH